MKSHKHIGSRKARLRRNAGGGNLLVVLGLGLGGYALWRWSQQKTGGSAVAAPASSSMTADAAWGVYDARPTKGEPGPQMTRADFNRLWPTLTPAEKTLFVQMSRMTRAETEAFMGRKMAETPPDPVFSAFLGKMMAAAASSMAASSPAMPPEPPAAPLPPPPSSAAAPKGTSGIGNYYNEP